MEKTLTLLVESSRVLIKNGYYFLPKRSKLVSRRIRNIPQSKKYLTQASLISFLFKLVPWIKMVGISGSLAIENVSEKDDIDMFIVTGSNRLWVSRLLLILILTIAGKRREKHISTKKAQGKICINILLEESKLAQKNRDIYIAHEVLQMKVLWQKDGIYQKFLEDNMWVFKCLPNWQTSQRFQIHDLGFIKKRLFESAVTGRSPMIDFLEGFCKWVQLKYMGKPKGKERIENGALYFHPRDYREEVLNKYQKRLKKFRLE